MCGIAGYSLAPGVDVDASRLTKLFLGGLAERGEDASGYASRRPDGAVDVVKRDLPPHEFITNVPVAHAPGTTEGIVHVRDHTKGRPSHHGNNHPIRHGAVCGVHNGIIQNDDELFARHGRDRAMPGMSVDSEAIFMLVDVYGHDLPGAFAELVGSYSTAFFDDRRPDDLLVARGKGRPLELARGDGFTLFASTRMAIDFVVDRVELQVEVSTVPVGTLLVLGDGVVRDEQRFEVTPFTEKPTVTYDAGSEAARRARELADAQAGEAAAG